MEQKNCICNSIEQNKTNFFFFRGVSKVKYKIYLKHQKYNLAKNKTVINEIRSYKLNLAVAVPLILVVEVEEG